MTTLLACTDGSTYASSLYRHAAWAAQRLKVRIEVLHTLDHHRERALGVDFSGSIGINASLHLTEELAQLEEAQGRVQRLKGKAIIEDARHQLVEAGCHDIVTTLRHGSLVETLEELESRCELVVIGKRGAHADSAPNHLGANLERVIRTAIRPVLVTAQTYQPIERFLLAYDGGPSILKAIEFALANPLLTNLHCHLVRAGQIDSKATYYLEETAARMRQAGYTVTTHAISETPDKVIPDIIQQENIQLLVMGAYGHSPIRTLILGSLTTNMMRTCPISLLMFR